MDTTTEADSVSAGEPAWSAPSSAVVHDLRERSHRLEVRMREITASGQPSAGVSLVGVGLQDIVQGMARLDERTRSSVWNMQRNTRYAVGALFDDLNERGRQRGIESRFAAVPGLPRNHPLATSIWPTFGWRRSSSR